MIPHELEHQVHEGDTISINNFLFMLFYFKRILKTCVTFFKKNLNKIMAEMKIRLKLHVI